MRRGKGARLSPGPPPERAEVAASELVADISGHGPAVVLLHGQPGRAADWDPLVGYLDRSFTVVTPDRLGYGRTGGAAGDFVANADATVALLDRLGIDRAILVGHSWGGGVAIAGAEQHPGRVAGVVLLASVGPTGSITMLDRILASRPLGDLAAAVAIGGPERLLRRPAFRRRIEPHLPARARHVFGVPGRPGATASTWRTFADEQRIFVRSVGALATGLGALAVPVTVVTGTADRIVAPEVAGRLAEAIPGAELLRVPRVGHLLMREAPRAVADAVIRTARRAALM